MTRLVLLPLLNFSMASPASTSCGAASGSVPIHSKRACGNCGQRSAIAAFAATLSDRVANSGLWSKIFRHNIRSLCVLGQAASGQYPIRRKKRSIMGR